MQRRRQFRITLIFLSLVVLSVAGFSLHTSAAEAGTSSEQSGSAAADAPINIPVGIFVTSVYGIDFRSEHYTVSFWLWATFPTEAMNKIAGEEFKPFNKIEIVNAQSKTISPTDQYIIPDSVNGRTYAIAKLTATITQHWNVRTFPFDRQDLTIVMESIGIPSSAIRFVPDTQNSLVSEELKISGWKIDNLELESLNYKYRSTFGEPGGQIGEYPRIVVRIPISRIGWRLFINSFMGFFISFFILSLIYFIDANSRTGPIMSAIFTAVGNKYTIDTYFPNQSAFGLSDLVQICSFGMIAVAFVTTIVSLRLEKADKHHQAKMVDRLALFVFVPGYIIIIAIGTFLTIVFPSSV